MKSFQIRCLRDILGITLWNRARNTDILERTGVLPVEEQLRQRRLQWFGHVWRKPTDRPQRHLMRCRPSGRKRPPGGALLRWCDLISRDLSWTEAMMDRPELIALIIQSWSTLDSAVASAVVSFSLNIRNRYGEQRRRCVWGISFCKIYSSHCLHVVTPRQLFHIVV